MRNFPASLVLGTAFALGFSTAASAQQSAPASGSGDAKRGEVLVETCMGCHGIPGYRNAYPSFRVPKLGGQKPEYLVIALQGYRNSTRPHGTMHAQAMSMSDQDMQDIAAFFAAQGEPATGNASGQPPEKAATCVACHGERGISPAPNWPSLAGQHEDYLRHSLEQYRNGERKDPVMGAQAQTLTDEDIEALSAYFADQSGLFTVEYTGRSGGR